MKLLLILVIALTLGGLLIWLADFQPGFVLLQYGDWSLETSLIVFAAMFLLLLLAGYFVLRSSMLLKQSPARLASWQQQLRHKRASQALTKGLITLEEGRWAEAERLLVRHAGNSETPLLHYLAAARAAQKQSAPARRDNYLKLAHETTEGADIAIGVVQAELQLSADQKEQALATLQHLRQVAPKHPYVLHLLQQLYQDTDQWQAVQSVLPDLRKRHVMDNNAINELGVEAVVGQLHHALVREDWQRMAQIWEQTPAKVRNSEAMLIPYTKGLIAQGEHAQAVSLIEQFLRKSWSDQLIYQYGLIPGVSLLKRLSFAEKWLKQHEENPWLLLSLGRLAAASKLWAKAEAYLRTSIEHGPRGETFLVLAEVLMAQDKRDVAASIYRQGLEWQLKAGH
ncbi:MAG TPA: heme biosynthesis HemY N-terminal domain-containing protein [Methylophaga sp.]|nr:heme biosynthesis HemY N-terminal domain-containing protein [Methylophaga sp.]